MAKDTSAAQDVVAGSVGGTETETDAARAKGVVELVHRDAEGNVIDEWTEENLVVNVGRENYLKAQLKGDDTVQASTWFVGLIQGTTTSITLNSTDTMAAHGGWSESTNYSEATRPSWDSGAVGSTATATVSNSSSVASFSINADSTTAGVFLASTNTKGGAGGTLHSEVKFGQTRSMSSGDSLDVTYTQKVTT